MIANNYVPEERQNELFSMPKDVDKERYLLQQKQLEILKELDRVCKALGLNYCLAFGTCLGAIRHKGFIPWDDDIDVYMPIEDFETLKEHCKDFKDPFFLQTQETDPEFGLMIGRVRNSQTTLIEASETSRDINHGIFIDIYPLFYSPENGIGAKKLLIASMMYRLMLYGQVPLNRGRVMKIGATVLLKFTSRKMRSRIITKAYKVMKGEKSTDYLTSLYGDEANIRYPYSWFFPFKRVTFEDIKVPVPADPDKYLTITYGDYMKLPPIEKQKFHHSYICIDFDTSYKEYRGKLYCK